MYAVFTEVNASEADIEAGHEFLPNVPCRRPVNAEPREAIGWLPKAVVAWAW